MSSIIAIDLGAANTRVAAFNKGVPEVFPLREGKKLSSIVAVKKDNVVVGSFALKSSAPNTIVTGATHPSQNLIALSWSNETNDGKYQFTNQTQTWTRQQIIAEILKETLKGAKTTSKKVVVTAPDFADQHYRQLILQSANVAGLEVVQLVNHTTAIAMAYSYITKSMEDHHVLLINFGASSFTVSVFQKAQNDMRLVSTSGTCSFGGDSFTLRLMTHFLNQKTHQIPEKYVNDKKFLKVLRNDMEKAIEELAFSGDTRIEIEYDDATIYPQSTFTRTDFEIVCKKELDEIKKHIILTLLGARHNGIIPQRVFLCGGSSNQHILKEFLQKSCGLTDFETSILAEEAVVIGAAVKAAMLEGVYRDSRVAIVPNYVMGNLYVNINGVSTRLMNGNRKLPVKDRMFPDVKLDSRTIPLNLILVNDDGQTVAAVPLKENDQLEIFFDIDKNGIWSMTTKENLLKIEYILQYGEEPHLLADTDLVKLREIAGAETSNKKESIQLLATIVRYLTDEQSIVSDYNHQVASDLYHKLLNYLSQKLHGVSQHSNSWEYNNLIQTQTKLLEETSKLSKLELVDKGSVNQLASDVKNQLEELMRKPIPELRPNVELPVIHNIHLQNQLVSNFNSQQNSQHNYGINEIKNQAQYDGHGEPKNYDRVLMNTSGPIKFPSSNQNHQALTPEVQHFVQDRHGLKQLANTNSSQQTGFGMPNSRGQVTGHEHESIQTTTNSKWRQSPPYGNNLPQQTHQGVEQANQLFESVNRTPLKDLKDKASIEIKNLIKKWKGYPDTARGSIEKRLNDFKEKIMKAKSYEDYDICYQDFDQYRRNNRLT